MCSSAIDFCANDILFLSQFEIDGIVAATKENKICGSATVPLCLLFDSHRQSNTHSSLFAGAILNAPPPHSPEQRFSLLVLSTLAAVI